ncbi:MAG: S41 family peptidase [Acidimicrobiia bacterium]
MRRRFLLALLLVLAACTTPAADPTTTAPSTTSPSTSLPASVDTAPVDETAPDRRDFDLAGCEEPGDFALLCEAVELVSVYYVDDVEVADLAAAAALGAAQAPDDSWSAPFTCAVPDPSFAPVCERAVERSSSPLAAAEAAVAGMVRFALDPNSSYLDAAALAASQEEQRGRVEGIGALVATEDRTAPDPASTPCPILSDTCRMVIVSTIEGSPATAAGVLAGDEIVEVDGERVDGWTIEEVTSRVRGPAGTDVIIGVLRAGAELRFAITRAAIEIPVAQWEVVDDGVGYLRLNLFTENADEQVHIGLEELIEAGATTIVFDLRDNPGGSLDTAVRVASEFLAEGLVLKTVGPGEETPYPVVAGGAATDPSTDVVVVVNRGSASASEVVAGVLQETGRAILVGDRTFGKNTVQRRFGLSNGGALRLTIARWTTPDGLDFGLTGLEPDVGGEVAASLSRPEVVARALELAALG